MISLFAGGQEDRNELVSALSDLAASLFVAHTVAELDHRFMPSERVKIHRIQKRTVQVEDGGFRQFKFSTFGGKAPAYHSCIRIDPVAQRSASAFPPGPPWPRLGGYGRYLPPLFELRFWNLHLECAFFVQLNAGRRKETKMEAIAPQSVQTEIAEPSLYGVSWPAVLAGAAASCALTLVLLSFGAGMGFAVVSPWTGSGVSSTTFEIGTGLYFIVMAMISSAVGGYLAGRLRTKWTGIQTAEVQFRDTAHGFLAWAVASVFGAIVLASPASSLIGGAASGTTSATTNSAQSSPMDGYVDALLRSNNPSGQAQQSSSDSHGEMVRLFTTSFRQDGDLKPGDRTYVAKVVSARTGLSQADAEKRVTDVSNQMKADLDRARKTAMQLAIWLTLSLFIGAFSAAAAAMEGGGLRDGTWGKRTYAKTALSR
ncbi:hypothetical protein [Bradyrhizobium sp. 197]|uniref:hypothetical protein n=1 Tax=Bradyrhizobium sp. 197 TaxID=2782663 RepID=UPI001FF9C762|nr:hypothetical protein [Bradyrhizobium sp. 197]